jgi:hypothetical protein
MRVLFDQATPVPLRSFLQAIRCAPPAAHEGWDRLLNGEWLKAAAAAGFDVLLTTDKNLRYQQNLRGRKLAIVVLRKGRWDLIRRHAAAVVAAVNADIPGSHAEVEIPYE